MLRSAASPGSVGFGRFGGGTSGLLMTPLPTGHLYLDDRCSTALVSRFRSSHHCAARSLANFGIKGTLAIYDSSAVFGCEVPTQTRGYPDRNFKSTALALTLPLHRPEPDIATAEPVGPADAID